ncbi:hypothetical protein LV457_13295 [Mycobacterium sp. MYCO198283]|uniref:hypothetical protein n=1 Tax=Mycobacterium sp. MYCO198283 TaxID=2883505 RepID=UPI001E30FB39|nr:hypothetical protein [Mycobacterium sp. MYCO198283]MCG5433254.1 hypothetical protein [Mycobacterium sp. MYCO198283]
MIRESLAVAAVGVAALAGAPAASADYRGDVPGIVYDASLHAPCYSWERFIFGRGPDGQAVACHYIPNQWPPVYTGFWVISYPLYGVQDVGAPCPNPRGAAAQSPDGRPMVCTASRGWQPGRLTGAGFIPE